jgi:hypothetical protein
MWLSFFVLLLVCFGLGYLKTGSAEGSAVLTAWIAPLILVACYFEARSRQTPTRAEVMLARSWLMIRRAVCFFGALVLGCTGAFGLKHSFAQPGWLAFAGVLICFLLAGACLWWGIYGTARVRGFADDRSTHEERKRRYGWK